MKMQTIVFVILFLSSSVLFSQQFIRVGSESNIETTPEFGILLAGGAQDNNDGMRWLAQRANGGDVVVLRASGGGGYNNYILTQLGEEINSVTTIIIESNAQANDSEVCEAVDQADMIFIAGGNQWNYYNHWKGTCLQVALNRHVNEKAAPIGGTSAGLAVLGEVVFTAESGSVWSQEALGNPFHFRVKLSNEFLQVPFMENMVTDSHYDRIYGDDNNRHGRHTAFLARMINDWQMNARGIGVDEYTAVAVDQHGIARVFGNPSYQDNAWFLLANAIPETVEQGQPLHWYNEQNALSVHRVRGNFQGSNTFDLNNWQEGEGGEWFRWFVDEGTLLQEPAGYTNLTFNIIRSDNSQPVDGVNIHVGGLRNLKTNTDGEALFANALPDNSLSVNFTREGFQDLQQDITINETNDTITIAMIPLSVSAETLEKPFHVRVFPNPVSDYLWIEPAQNTMIGRYILYDLSGRMLLQGDHQHHGSLQLNLYGISKGVYLLELNDTENRKHTIKVVKTD